jgi:hypothetical protein
MEEKTIGEVRVRPEYRELAEEEKQAVNDFKDTAATFINACEQLKIPGNGERARLVAIAQTKMEEAVMFAVKAVTCPE